MIRFINDNKRHAKSNEKKLTAYKIAISKNENYVWQTRQAQAQSSAGRMRVIAASIFWSLSEQKWEIMTNRPNEWKKKINTWLTEDALKNAE